jgi:hypothetical protein
MTHAGEGNARQAHPQHRPGGFEGETHCRDSSVIVMAIGFPETNAVDAGDGGGSVRALATILHNQALATILRQRRG